MTKQVPELLSADDLTREGYLERTPSATQQSDDEKIKEEMLILQLLAGFHEDENKVPLTDYLAPDSCEGESARVALARQVRAGTLSYLVRDLLALMIAPEIPSPLGIKPTRKLTFENFRKPSTWARDQVVIHFFKQSIMRSNASLKATMYDAVDRFKIGRSRVYQIWKEHTQRRR
jgi:hypothetical protein